MTVEGAVYIDSLNPALPPGNDPKSEGDDHLRLIKSVLKSTFPNLTGAMTATQAQLNNITGYVLKAGDTMTGSLSLNGSILFFNDAAGVQAGYMGRYGTAGAAGSGLGFVNAAYTQWIFQIGNNGDCTIPGQYYGAGGLMTGRLTLRQGPAAGELGLGSPEGFTCFMRGKSGAGMEWVNDAYNAVIANMDNGGALTVANFTSTGRVNAQENLWSFNSCYTGNGASFFGPDGNCYGSAWGGYLSNWMGGKANNGAQCQWSSGINELASAMGGNNTVDGGSPWVMEGVRVTTGTDINRIYPRTIWLRNQ
jgi:hypothetical protein